MHIPAAPPGKSTVARQAPDGVHAAPRCRRRRPEASASRRARGATISAVPRLRRGGAGCGRPVRESVRTRRRPTIHGPAALSTPAVPVSHMGQPGTVAERREDRSPATGCRKNGSVRRQFRRSARHPGRVRDSSRARGMGRRTSQLVVAVQDPLCAPAGLTPRRGD